MTKVGFCTCSLWGLPTKFTPWVYRSGFEGPSGCALWGTAPPSPWVADATEQSNGQCKVQFKSLCRGWVFLWPILICWPAGLTYVFISSTLSFTRKDPVVFSQFSSGQFTLVEFYGPLAQMRDAGDNSIPSHVATRIYSYKVICQANSQLKSNLTSVVQINETLPMN